MADDKKPKIDLKTRLQKMGGAAGPVAAPTPTPMPNVSPSGVPIPMPPRSVPAPAVAPAIPPPMGVGLSAPPPALDPNNPLAAVVKGSFSASAPSAPPPRAEPQRIEVDEQAVQHARGSVRKQMLVLMLVACGISIGIGVAAGNASAKGAGRTKAQSDAKLLQGDVGKAKDSLTQLADKLDAGIKTLKDKKYPDTLAQDLAKINVDFDGGKLGGKRFDGMGVETTAAIVDFVTRVQGVNDKKKFVQGLLTKLQKSITEELKAAETGQVTYTWVAVVDRDRWGEGVYIGALQPPFVPTKDKPNLPDKLTFLNPRTGNGNVEMPHYQGGDVKEKAPVAMHINPASWERACPSTEKGQIAQLVRQMASLKDEVRHEKGLAQASDNVIDEPKPDMIELATNLGDQLGKAAQ